MLRMLILRLRLGLKDVVVLNDLGSIRDGLTNPDVLFRPDNFAFCTIGIDAIGSLSGEPWKVNRRYSFHVLRNLGFPRKGMEEHIQESVQHFADFLASGEGKPRVVSQQLATSVSNNITTLVFGESYPLDHPTARLIENMLTKFLRHASFLSVEDFLPPVRLLATCIPNTRLEIMKRVFTQLAKLVRNEINDRQGRMEHYIGRDFIDGYLRKIEENKGATSHYNLGSLEGSTLNFYSASTNTVRTAVLWDLYIMASDPDGLQARVQREIDSALGRHKTPDWDDRRRMPFTMACILEQQRWRTAAPIGIPRAAERDTFIGGYHIPAGTVVISNLWSLHNDPKYWHNPSQYDPMRFLNSDGTEVDDKQPAFLPFSMGQSLALMEIFLYVTGILQRFTVLPEEGVTLSLDAEDALVSVANETQKLRFIAR
ncbi:hypothetical protein HPB48_018655 [Haemaphysalis longicornis]|uniref:Cytochrome P450 n=1 Tax=Haemaphysalis longicornis TaxID=44386 RepID=A0A9J6GH64_HAELO|nr:hypothetical protein HPB48_018655 [Haemaphysalis longicornis]